MHHLLDDKLLFLANELRGFIFGFVHVGIMILGYYTGWSINRGLKIISNGYIAGLWGAAISHILADLIASFLDPHVRSMILGIIIGGVIPLIFIPFFEKYIIKSKNHIVVGDHEDIKKDLDSH